MALGLMGSLIEHGGEAEELALRRLVHDDFLLIFIHSRDPHHAGRPARKLVRPGRRSSRCVGAA